MNRLDRIERAHAIAWDDDETSWLLLHAAIPGLLAIARDARDLVACYDHPSQNSPGAVAALARMRADLADFEAA